MRSPIQRLLIVLAIVITTAVLVPAALVLVVDPFRIYHDAWFGQGLSPNQRYQNAGLINRYLADPASPYDSVILGTSMSANVRSAEIEAIFHSGKALRLMIKGGAADETAYTLRHALAGGQVRHLFWEINPWHYLDDYEASRLDGVFPRYLYNRNWLDDGPYLFNLDLLKVSWRILKGDHAEFDLTLETIGTSLYQDFKHESFNLNMQESLAQGYASPLQLEKLPLEKRIDVHQRLQQELFPLLDELCQSGMDTVLFLPPLSRLYYEEQGMRSVQVIYMPRQILARIKNCKNIRLHAFDLLPLTEDLNDYRDSMHYTEATSRWLLQRVAQGKNCLTENDITHYEDAWIDRINAHRVHSSYPAAPVFADE